MAQQITIDIIAETQKLQKGLDEANKKLQGIQTATQNVQQLGTAFAGVGIAAAGFGVATGFINNATEASSDLNESLSKNEVIFGDVAGEIEKFADSAANGLGQSKVQALDAASTFATFGKSAGLAGDDLVEFSTEFVTLASDLASFNNTTPEDAITAIGAALRGESEPIRRYGVLLNDAALRQEALNQGIYDGEGALSAQQKVLAAGALILKQTTDAQGDFARTSDGLANSQRTLEANQANLNAEMGTIFLPVMKELVNVMKTVIGIFTSLPKPLQTTIIVVGLLAATLGPVVLLTSSLLTAFTAIKSVLGGFTIATRIAAIAQGAFNLVLSLNPLAAVAIAIAAVVAALAFFFTQTETGRRIWEQFTRFLTDTMRNVSDFFKQAWENISKTVTDVFEGITETINSALAFIGDLFRSVLEVIRRLVEGDFTVIKEFIENIFKGIQVFLDAILNAIFGIIRFYVETWTKIFETGFNLIKTIIENVMGIIEYLIDGGWNNIVNGTISAFNSIRDQAGKIWGEIRSRITGFINQIVNAFQEIPNTMYNLGRNIVEGIWNGISGLTTWFRDKVLGFFGDLLPGWVKDVLGISSPSKLFEEIGKAVVQGTVQGLDVPKVSAGQGIAGQQAVTININAGLGTDPYELGRAVTEALNKYASISRVRVV